MLKSSLITLGKIAVAGFLLVWLQRSGQLDFAQLRLFREDMALVAATLFYFIVGLVCMGTWRWKTLLEGAGYTITWRRAVTLQMTGFFFNSVMPGAVGGDIIKIAYVIRDNPGRSKAQVMMTALLDRIVGLAGLFMICWLMILINLETVRDLKVFQSMLGLITAVTVGFAVFFFAALYHYKGTDPFLKVFKWSFPGMKFVEKLYTALRVYRYARGSIVLSLMISLCIQLTSLLLFYYITTKVSGSAPDFGKIAVIYPIGVTTTAIPITPAGLGVGHVAFDQLFQMVGLDHGANAFNLFALSQLFLNLTGIIPYLTLKKIPKQEFDEVTSESDKVTV
ncbi:MAG: flippase-like domain-containing protein [Proteobacteria bacterium]|nr:MAG: flippase-like domain-containing protein [Pseudomonadota bacterium]